MINIFERGLRKPLRGPSGSAQQMPAPELLVYGRMLLYGFLLAEMYLIGLYGADRFGQGISLILPTIATFALIFAYCAVAITYLWERGAFRQLRHILVSRRLDIWLYLAFGAWANYLVAPKLAVFHKALARQDPLWGLLVASLFLVLMVVTVARHRNSLRSDVHGQARYLSDDAIENGQDDLLGVSQQAQTFAETVLTSTSQSGLVFGVEAPWGSGKTSFINLSEKLWAESSEVVIVKFQTLRYASEPDLADRFIREVCAAIKQRAFVPEFAPVADRYSRMLKGKADLSFLGFKLSVEPSSETVDELLEGVDAVLRQSKKRLIVIVEDLDRLEAKLVNNVLFTIRRTFRLSRAVYVLCYDAENLLVGREEGVRAKEFLEKFITIKVSLFIDGETLQRFLKFDWQADSLRFPLIPADTMFRLSALLNVVADMIVGKDAHPYAPLIGDLRKLKRLVNALLSMDLDKVDFDRCDFDRRDLLHLVLLHLRYPTVFRRIYTEETEGRKGIFSVRMLDIGGTKKYGNDPAFQDYIKSLEDPAKFLIRHLFDVEVLEFGDIGAVDDEAVASRACFNTSRRNLEEYLKLIVRLRIPIEIQTHRFYKNAVDEFKSKRRQLKAILDSGKFALDGGGLPVHEEFWRLLLSNAFDLSSSQVDEAIDCLVELLPYYPSADLESVSLRSKAVYTMAAILDRVGYVTALSGDFKNNVDVRPIAWRILGSQECSGPSLVHRLAALERGALGWNDLMTFRLVCSVDRGGGLQNIYRGLLQFENPAAVGGGPVPELAVNSMRTLSQEVFKLFDERYIRPKINFYLAVDELSVEEIWGAAFTVQNDETAVDAEVVRSNVKSFVVYQLTNQAKGTGAGVGCGVYDPEGVVDRGGIRSAMAEYLLGFCFNPDIKLEHARVFGDFCIMCYRDAAVLRFTEPTDSSIERALCAFLPERALAKYWLRHGDLLQESLLKLERTVVAHRFRASYAETLPEVFSVLDALAGIQKTPEAAQEM